MCDSLRRWVLLLGICGALNWSGLGAGPEFILLIDSSATMARRKAATLATARDLVRTGVHRRMKDGERMGVWFFDEIVYTNTPLVWDSRRGEDFGRLMVAYFESRAFRKESRVDRAVQFLNRELAKSPNLTAMILTDAAAPLEGTGFDEGINSLLWDNRDRFARDGKPFLITLLGHDGKWAGYGVHVKLGEAIELPALPENADSLAKAMRVLRGEKLPEPPKMVEEPKVVAEQPKVEIKEEPKVVEVPKAVEPAPPPAPVPAPVVEKAEPKVEVAVAAPPTPAVVEEPKAEVEVPVEKPKPVEVVAVVEPVKPKASMWPILMAAFGILAAIGAAVWLKMSEPKPPSLMAQAIALRKQKSVNSDDRSRSDVR